MKTIKIIYWVLRGLADLFWSIKEICEILFGDDDDKPKPDKK